MKVVKIPLFKGGLGKADGTELAPDMVVKELENIYSTEGSITPLFETDKVDVNHSNIDETHENIYKKIKQIKEKFIIIGGDHSLTFSSFRAFAGNFQNPGMIIFDAHPDTYFVEGDMLSHENYLSMIIRDGIVKPENVMIIGARNSDPNELEFMQKQRIKSFPMRNLFGNLHEVCDTVMENARNFDALYLSIDIDAVDAAFAPGTGYPEPGGLSSRELIYFLQRLKRLKNLKGIDLVEINPKKDINNMTVKLGAKIVVELS